MPSAAIPQLLLDQVFNDMDHYAEQIGWDLEFRQLDGGSLAARAGLITAPVSASLRVEFNRGFHQQGKPPGELIILGLPDESAGEFRWCGANARGGDILNFNLDPGFEGVSGAGFSGYVLMFHRSLIDDVRQALGTDIDIGKVIASASAWSGAGDRTRELRQQLSKTYRSTGGVPGTECPTASELLDGTAASSLLEILSGGEAAPDRAGFATRRRTLSLALDYIENSVHHPITVLDLCRASGASESTLYRAFHDRFGIGPKAYLRIYCLTAVRRALITADPSRHIGDIASDWGFWHLGQFAVDYRKQFGELPSDTRASVIKDSEI